MGAPHLELGQLGERTARQYLESRGLRFMAANVRTPYGEVDLLMREGATLVIVEVKARQGGRQGVPQAAVDAKRLTRLANAATALAEDEPWRIDVVALQGARLEHLINVTA